MLQPDIRALLHYNPIIGRLLVDYDERCVRCPMKLDLLTPANQGVPWTKLQNPPNDGYLTPRLATDAETSSHCLSSGVAFPPAMLALMQTF